MAESPFSRRRGSGCSCTLCGRPVAAGRLFCDRSCARSWALAVLRSRFGQHAEAVVAVIEPYWGREAAELIVREGAW